MPTQQNFRAAFEFQIFQSFQRGTNNNKYSFKCYVNGITFLSNLSFVVGKSGWELILRSWVEDWKMSSLVEFLSYVLVLQGN